jgi:hypothetical protein
MQATTAWIEGVRGRAAQRRSALLRSTLATLPRPVRIIDLGGSGDMWRRWGVVEADGLRIVLANTHRLDPTHRDEAPPGDFVTSIVADVRHFAPADFAAYDLVFSNSMLEHLPSREDQARLAQRIAASGKPYFIQVPNKRCIVDPHFPHPLAAFFALWPRAMQVQVLQWHRLGARSRAYSREEALLRVGSYHPLARGELAALFPQARIVTEWNLGLPMSLVAIG